MQPPKCPKCAERHWQIEGCGLLSAGEKDVIRRAAAEAPAVVAAELRGIASGGFPYNVVEQPEIVGTNVLNTGQGLAAAEPLTEEGAALKFPVWPEKFGRHPLGEGVERAAAAILNEPGVALTSTAHPSAPIAKRPRLHPAALETVEISDDGWTDEQRARAIIVAEGRRLLAVRKGLKLSQPKFSAAFHVPVGTLRGWESGRHKMPPYFLALLTVIEREPKAVFRALGVKP